MSEIKNDLNIDLNNLDKSNWKTYRFDEIAKNVSERVEPKNTDLKVYIGLEHIDSESLYIKRHGTPDDVNGTKLKFYKGDIIFGRRRAYQRKAGIAKWDGICSAHAMVFRANPEVINPELFPFFLHSDLFMNRAIDISVGSLSPTINWSTLKHQEFLLPPIEHQLKIAKLFISIDEAINKQSQLLSKLEVNLNTYLWRTFTSHIGNESRKEPLKCKSLFQTRWEKRLYPVRWKSIKLSEAILTSQSGFAEGKRDDSGVAQLRMNNVTRDGRIDLSKISMVPHRNNLKRYLISIDDVLFCNTNSEDLVGKTVLATREIESFCFSNHFTRLRANEKLLTQKFLYLWLKFHFDIGLFGRLCTKWIGQAAVQTDSLLNLQIILPSLEEQNEASYFCQKIEDNIDLVKAKIISSNQLQKSLISKVF